MKQLTEIARRKVIALVSEVDVENTTVQEICTDLRRRMFKPPHGKNWTEKKLLEVLAIPEETVADQLIQVCHLCYHAIDIDLTICPECWTELLTKEN